MDEHHKEEYPRDIDGGAYNWELVMKQSGGRLGKGPVLAIHKLAKIAGESNVVEKHVCVCSACKRRWVWRWVRKNG